MTEKQYQRLLVLASPTLFALAPGRRDWGPLLRRGWVAAVAEDDGSRYLPPLQITAAGLRALADAADRYGLPEWRDKANPPKQLKEHPEVTRLKERLEKAERAAQANERDASYFRSRLRQIAMLVEEGDLR